MSKKQATAKIEKAGYSLTYCMSGWIIAQKGWDKYKADTLTGLIKLIFKPL